MFKLAENTQKQMNGIYNYQHMSKQLNPKGGEISKSQTPQATFTSGSRSPPLLPPPRYSKERER
jgi:hypothetical protein